MACQHCSNQISAAEKQSGSVLGAAGYFGDSVGGGCAQSLEYDEMSVRGRLDDLGTAIDGLLNAVEALRYSLEPVLAGEVPTTVGSISPPVMPDCAIAARISGQSARVMGLYVEVSALLARVRV